VQPKNWAVVPTVVGYHRYDTPSKLLLPNKIWTLQSLVTNYFCRLPKQELISKVCRCINRARGRILLSVLRTQLDVL